MWMIPWDKVKVTVTSILQVVVLRKSTDMNKLYPFSHSLSLIWFSVVGVGQMRREIMQSNILLFLIVRFKTKKQSYILSCVSQLL